MLYSSGSTAFWTEKPLCAEGEAQFSAGSTYLQECKSRESLTKRKRYSKLIAQV